MRDPGDHRKEQGFTLVELLVAMSLLTGVLTLSTTVLVKVLEDTRSVTERAGAVDQARLAVAQMDRQIRSGNVLMAPTDDEMRVFTQSNGEQKCVQWQVVSATDVLRSRSWSPTWQTDGLVTGWSTVARGITNDTSSTSTQKPFALQGAATAYNSRLISIRLFAQVSQKGGRPVEVNTSISGRNTNYGYDANICSPIPPL